MENQIIKYIPIKSDDVGTIIWRENLYKGTPVYIGLLNALVVVVCTQYNAIEYDAISIRFRLRNYELTKGEIPKSKAIATTYRHGYVLSDLREGLWLSAAELLKINNAMEDLLDEFKINFTTIR